MVIKIGPPIKPTKLSVHGLLGPIAGSPVCLLVHTNILHLFRAFEAPTAEITLMETALVELRIVVQHCFYKQHGGSVIRSSISSPCSILLLVKSFQFFNFPPSHKISTTKYNSSEINMYFWIGLDNVISSKLRLDDSSP